MLSNNSNVPIQRHIPKVASSVAGQKTLFVPILGQSNGEYLSWIYEPYKPGATENNLSGAIVLERELANLSGSNIVTSDTRETNFAVGGSTVNGDLVNLDDNFVWWYPESEQPGGALKLAEQGLETWLGDGGAKPTDEIAIIWSQGESDVGYLSDGSAASREQYKQSTLAVFDYLRTNLDYADVTFYLVPTGRLQEQGAANRGISESGIVSINEGRAIIREVQSEIALERDDVQLATDYSDLNMVYEEGELYGDSYDQDFAAWSTDFWHLGHDSLQVNGDRLAQYIALDRGESNVISFTDSFGDSAESTSLTRDGLLDLNISANAKPGLIQGTDLPDVVVGTAAADEISGGIGNDVIVATPGVDTLTGGAGNDVLFYESVADADRILDFELNRDRLDVSELLIQSGYTGTDPVGDGYISTVAPSSNSLEILFDTDGTGTSPASTIAILDNIDPIAFEAGISEQLITIPTEF